MRRKFQFPYKGWKKSKGRDEGHAIVWDTIDAEIIKEFIKHKKRTVSQLVKALSHLEFTSSKRVGIDGIEKLRETGWKKVDIDTSQFLKLDEEREKILRERGFTSELKVGGQLMTKKIVGVSSRTVLTHLEKLEKDGAIRIIKKINKKTDFSKVKPFGIRFICEYANPEWIITNEKSMEIGWKGLKELKKKFGKVIIIREWFGDIDLIYYA